MSGLCILIPSPRSALLLFTTGVSQIRGSADAAPGRVQQRGVPQGDLMSLLGRVGPLHRRLPAYSLFMCLRSPNRPGVHGGRCI